MSTVVSHLAAFGIAALILAAPLAARDVGQGWLTEDEIRSHLSGKSIEGEYTSGRPFRETYEAGGRVAYEDDIRSNGGRWSVEAGTFCTIYDNDPTGGCFRVRKVGANCFEFFFVARTEELARKDPREPDWTARAWIEGQASTCKERITA